MGLYVSFYVRTYIHARVQNMSTTPKKSSKNIALGFADKDNDDIATPKDLYDPLNAEFNFDFDPCPLKAEFNGLNVKWGKSNFVNPPFSNVPGFLKKAIEEASRHNATSVFLICARTSSSYWHSYVFPYADEIRFLKGTVKFDGYKKGFPHPIAIVVIRPTVTLKRLFHNMSNFKSTSIGPYEYKNVSWFTVMEEFDMDDHEEVLHHNNNNNNNNNEPKKIVGPEAKPFDETFEK